MNENKTVYVRSLEESDRVKRITVNVETERPEPKTIKVVIRRPPSPELTLALEHISALIEIVEKDTIDGAGLANLPDEWQASYKAACQFLSEYSE